MTFKVRVIGMLVCVGMLAGCSAEKVPAPKAAAAPVAAVAIARGKIDTQKGILDIYAPVEGEVDAVAVTEGASVKRGQELLRLQATAAELDLSLLQAEIGQTEVALKGQQESLTRLTQQTKRLQEAANLGATEMQKVDEALAQQKQAETAVAMTRANLEILQKRQAIAQWQIQRLVIKAPADGRVLKVYAQAGSRAGAGKPVITYLPDGALVVRAEVNESFVVGLKEGMLADIVIESHPDAKPLVARLKKIGQVYRAAQLDDESQVRTNVRVLECVLEFEQQPDLRVGQNVRVSFRKQQ
ncbi:HlyD family secretion protein [Uliginosibacterium gangwonense]|uniref:HlyD family secretion protein n=1 Tax=Uliginosibacterium gangwonense TaxID=392736 RepID=UPI000373959E|nr:HlyD family efflux transporter periplasmic adaptor subunit [Uliginosibacterium gangwonense]